jgi:hypothetical protein
MSQTGGDAGCHLEFLFLHRGGRPPRRKSRIPSVSVCRPGLGDGDDVAGSSGRRLHVRVPWLVEEWANSMTALNMTICGRFPQRWLVALAVVLGVAAAVAGPVLAHEEHGHPTRIHEGSCEALGPVAFRLNGVGGSVDQENVPVGTPTAVNPDAAYQMLISGTTIGGTIEDLVASEHAVMIYESDEAMDAIACGNVGGALSGNTLVTGLAEVGVPGHIGFALFRSEGDQTVVLVVLGHGLAPVSASGAAGEVHAGEDKAAEDDHVATPDA